MRVQMNQMIYDDADPLCKCILEQADGKLYAFVQCIDSGMDGNARYTARYWGPFTHANPEGSIRRIMAYGGKWPMLPAEDAE